MSATTRQHEATRLRVGVDLGGTKIEVIALDAGGATRLRRRVPTPQDDYDAILERVAALVAEAERECGVTPGTARVGVGTPGSLSRATGLLRGSNSVCLNGRPIARDFEARLARPVKIANDANCFALSEAADGAGRGFDVVFGVILGTGVGGGLVVRGKLVGGANGIAGEWGHNPLPRPEADESPGPACFCGRHGCIETWLSGPGLVRDCYGTPERTLLGATADILGATADSEAIDGATERATADVADLVARAQSGDARCAAALVRYEGRLARALAHVINLLDPDAVVLGGGLSNVDRWYRTVPRLWGRWVFSDRVDTRLLRNVHGDSSGVRGAAWLAAEA